MSVKNKINFFQCNLQHCKAAVIELNNLNFRSQQFIGMVQEPYIMNNDIKMIDKMKLFRTKG